MYRLIATLLILMALPASADDDRGRGMEVDGLVRTYLLEIPATAPPVGRALVIAFHDANTSGTVMEHFSGLTEKARKEGFVVIYPDGTGPMKRLLSWNAGTCCGQPAVANTDDLAFAAMLIDEAVSALAVDPARVYLTGMGNGAMFAYRVAAEMPSRVAAVAAVSGGLAIAPSAIKAPMPVLHFHGTKDEFVPYAGGRGSHTPSGERYKPISETIDAWAKANGADPFIISVVQPAQDADDTSVIVNKHQAGEAGAEVVLYEIKGGGHTWPGRARDDGVLGLVNMDIDANAIIWDFFSHHRKG